jgi:hypothetical protein
MKFFDTEINVYSRGTFHPGTKRDRIVKDRVFAGTKEEPTTYYTTKYKTDVYTHPSGSLRAATAVTKEITEKHTGYKTVNVYKEFERKVTEGDSASVEVSFWFEPTSEEELTYFNMVCENQENIKRLFRKHENLSVLHPLQKKEIKQKIKTLFEFNYYVIGKAFMDRYSVPFDAEINAIKNWNTYEKQNHKFLKKQHNNMYGDDQALIAVVGTYAEIVSHNHAALNKAIKRKEEIESVREEICNKMCKLIDEITKDRS